MLERLRRRIFHLITFFFQLLLALVILPDLLFEFYFLLGCKISDDIYHWSNLISSKMWMFNTNFIVSIENSMIIRLNDNPLRLGQV